MKRDAQRVESLSQQALRIFRKQKVGHKRRIAQVERFLTKQAAVPSSLR